MTETNAGDSEGGQILTPTNPGETLQVTCDINGEYHVVNDFPGYGN